MYINYCEGETRYIHNTTKVGIAIESVLYRWCTHVRLLLMRRKKEGEREEGLHTGPSRSRINKIDSLVA